MQHDYRKELEQLLTQLKTEHDEINEKLHLPNAARTIRSGQESITELQPKEINQDQNKSLV